MRNSSKKLMAWVLAVIMAIPAFSVQLAFAGEETAANNRLNAILSSPSNLNVLSTAYSLTVSWDAPSGVYPGGDFITYDIIIAPERGMPQTFTGVSSPYEIMPLASDTMFDVFVFAVQGGTRSVPAKTTAWTQGLWDFGDITAWGAVLDQSVPLAAANGTWFVRAPHLADSTFTAGGVTHNVTPGMTIGTGANNLWHPHSIRTWRSSAAPNADLHFIQDEGNIFLRHTAHGGGGATSYMNLPNLGLAGELSFDLRADGTMDNGTFVQLREQNIGPHQNKQLAQFLFTGNGQVVFQRNTNTPQNFGGAVTWTGQGGTASISSDSWNTFRFIWDFNAGARWMRGVIEDADGNIVHDFGQSNMPNVALTAPNLLNFTVPGTSLGSKDIDNVMWSANYRTHPNPAGPANDVTVTNVAIDAPQGLAVEQGMSISLHADITPTNAWNRGIIWTSSNPSAATVDVNGRVTGHRGGMAEITAVSAQNPDIYYSVTIEVSGEVISAILTPPQNLSIQSIDTQAVTLVWDAPVGTYEGGGSISYVVTAAADGGEVRRFADISANILTVTGLIGDTAYDFKVYAVQDGTFSRPDKIYHFHKGTWDFEDIQNWGVVLDNNLGNTDADTWIARAPGINITPGTNIPAGGRYIPGTIFAWRGSTAPQANLRFTGEGGNTFLRSERLSAAGGSSEVYMNFPAFPIQGEVYMDFRTGSESSQGLELRLGENNPAVNNRKWQGRFIFTGPNVVEFQRVTNASAHTFGGPAPVYAAFGGSAIIPANEWITFRFVYNFATGSPTIRGIIEDSGGNIIHDSGEAALPVGNYTPPNFIAFVQGGGTGSVGPKDLDNVGFGSGYINVMPGPANDVDIEGIVLGSDTDFLVPLGGFISLAHQTVPSNAWNGFVTWQSGNETVATVDANGRIHGISEGEAEITVRSERNPDAYVVQTVEVTEEVLTMQFESFNTTIPIGESRRVRETIAPVSTLDTLYGIYEAPILTSSDESVAIIINNGFVRGVGPGTAVITGVRGSDLGRVTVTVIEPNYNDFERLRRNHRATILPWDLDPTDPEVIRVTASIDENAERLFGTMRRTFVYGDVGSQLWALPPGDMGAADLYSWLIPMAQALLLPGGRFYMDPKIFDTVVAGMEFNLNNMFRGHLNSTVSQQVRDLHYPVGHPERNRVSTQGAVRGFGWWHTDIGFPLRSITTLTLLAELGFPEELTQAHARRIHIVTPNHTWNNHSNAAGTPSHQSYKSFFMIMDGIFREDEARVRAGVAASFTGGQVGLQNGILGGQNGNGFYWDGSERGHTFFATSLAYGIGNLNTYGRILSTAGGESINGVPLVFSQSYIERMTNVVPQAYLNAVWRGAAMPSLGGRGLGRESNFGSDGGVTGALVDLLPGFPAESQAVIREHIASWATHNPRVMAGNNMARNSAIRAIVEDNNIIAREQTGIFAQNHQSRVFYRQENFVFNVAFNNNNANVRPHTSINNENIRGLFMGEGMTYLFLDNDQFQYGGDFNITADPFRMPGTTVDQHPNFNFGNGANGPNAQGNPQHTMGGTVVLRPEFGGMQNHAGEIGLTSFRQNFAGSVSSSGAPSLNVQGVRATANKSWFMLDGRVLALGTNITSNSGHPVVTSIDQRRISGNVESFVLNGIHVGTLASNNLTGNNWAHLAYEGTNGSAQLGWFIPAGEGQTLSVGTETRTGRWFDTGLGQSTDLRTGYFASLFFNHGANPTAQTYEYVILPNATHSQVEYFAARQSSDNPIYQVLHATNTLHAVYDFDNNVLMVVNFANAPVYVESPVTGITYRVSAAANILIEEIPLQDGSYNIHMAILDPVGNNTTIAVTMIGAEGTRLNADGNITVVTGEDRITVTAGQLTNFNQRRFNSWEVHLNVTPVDNTVLLENLALHRPVTASSTHSAAWISTSLLTDGITTGSQNRWAPVGGDGLPWFFVDLENVMSVNRVILYEWRDPQGYRTNHFSIHVSIDGVNWQLVHEVIAAGGNAIGTRGVFDFDAVLARYVRITFHTWRTGPNDQPTIHEIEVYGAVQHRHISYMHDMMYVSEEDISYIELNPNGEFDFGLLEYGYTQEYLDDIALTIVLSNPSQGIVHDLKVVLYGDTEAFVLYPELLTFFNDTLLIPVDFEKEFIVRPALGLEPGEYAMSITLTDESGEFEMVLVLSFRVGF